MNFTYLASVLHGYHPLKSVKNESMHHICLNSIKSHFVNSNSHIRLAKIMQSFSFFFFKNLLNVG